MKHKQFSLAVLLLITLLMGAGGGLLLRAAEADPMWTAWLVASAFAGVAVLFVVLMLLGRRTCQKCGAALPLLRVPKDMQQLLHGGCICLRCGTIVDAYGVPRLVAATASK